MTFPSKVQVGRHKLELEFDGTIRGQAQGLYYDKYQTDQGGKVLLATQMEATHARRMSFVIEPGFYIRRGTK